MNRCRLCKKPMMRVSSRYEPRDGRIVQAEVQFECRNGCGTRLTISDPQLPSKSVTESPVRTT